MAAYFTLRTYDANMVFFRKKADLIFGVAKCLQQIEMPDFLHVYA